MQAANTVTKVGLRDGLQGLQVSDSFGYDYINCKNYLQHCLQNLPSGKDWSSSALFSSTLFSFYIQSLSIVLKQENNSTININHHIMIILLPLVIILN